MSKSLYFSGLNGLRAIAALGVLISHFNLALPNFNVQGFSLFGFTNGKPKSWILGEHGVSIFFVLSGFLITYLLLLEFNKTNTIDVKKFYIRRLLRIWPIYFLFILLNVLILIIYKEFDLTTFLEQIFFYVFFLANIPFIFEQGLKNMHHLWSIGVEEQFYLFWPFLFLLIYRKLIKSLLVIILILSIFRIAIWYIAPFSTTALFSLVNRFDLMFFGALGALLLYKEHHVISIINTKVVQSFSWFIVILMAINYFKFINSIIEIFVVELITLFIIIGQIKLDNRLINLENTVFSYLGKLSFGIYVYHPLVLFLLQKLIPFNNQMNTYFYVSLIFTLLISFTILVAHLSYNHFEKHFIKLKGKFTIIKSTNENKNA